MDKVPDAVLKHILSFVSDAGGFLACEKTCIALQRVLQDHSDSLWRNCKECKLKYQNQQDCWPTTNRDKVLVVRALDQCHRWQRGSKSCSILRGVMSVVEWKRLAEQSLHVLIPLHGGNEPIWNNPTGNQLVGCSHKFPLRGDTSAVLMTLVESCLISQLERARTMAFHRTRHDPSQYPSVSLVDFQAQDQLQCFLFTTGDVKTSGTIYPGLKLLGLSPLPAVKAAIDSGVNFDETKRFQIVRRLAYAAGITKMDNAMFDLVWAQLVQLIIMLLWPGCVRLVHDEIQNDPGARQNLHGVQTMRDVPPPSYRSARPHACAVCEEQYEIVHTIVPGQVEQAAKGLGIAHKVYGLEWHVETDNDETSHEKSFQLLLKELAKAESKYSFERKKAPSQTTDETAPSEGNIVDGSNAGQILVDGLLFFDALEEEPKGSASVIGETRQHKLISTETDATRTSGGKVSSDEDSSDEEYIDDEVSDADDSDLENHVDFDVEDSELEDLDENSDDDDDDNDDDDDDDDDGDDYSEDDYSEEETVSDCTSSSDADDESHSDEQGYSSDDSEDLQISDEGIVLFDEDSDNEETTCISPSTVVQESTGYHDRIYVRELLAPI